MKKKYIALIKDSVTLASRRCFLEQKLLLLFILGAIFGSAWDGNS